MGRPCAQGVARHSSSDACLPGAVGAAEPDDRFTSSGWFSVGAILCGVG